jgi:hypothetical protein
MAELDSRHPLSERARLFALRLMTDVDKKNWVGNGDPDHPVIELVESVAKAGGKLAGALDSREWPPAADECGLCIAWLKRARGFLVEAEAAGAACRQRQLIPATELQSIREEIVAIRQEVDAAIVELRERLARGFD